MIIRDEGGDVAAVGTETPATSGALADESSADLPAEASNGPLPRIDRKDHRSLLEFGADAQDEFREVSAKVITHVKAKDAGTAGEAINKAVLALRGFDVSDLAGKSAPGIIARLFGAVHPVALALQRHETVNSQVQEINELLQDHYHELLADTDFLEAMYNAAIRGLRKLEDRIAHAEQELKIVEEEELPAARREAASGDAVKVQEADRLDSFRKDLERRLHNLRLTRSIAVNKSIPAIKTTQANDKTIVATIDDLLVNVVPAWSSEIAEAITMHRTLDAAKTVKAVKDLANEMIRRNADAFRESNKAVIEESERGIVDVETVKHVNEQTIKTIEERKIAYDAARKRRAEEQAILVECEERLKEALMDAESGADHGHEA